MTGDIFFDLVKFSMNLQFCAVILLKHIIYWFQNVVSKIIILKMINLATYTHFFYNSLVALLGQPHFYVYRLQTETLTRSQNISPVTEILHFFRSDKLLRPILCPTFFLPSASGHSS